MWGDGKSVGWIEKSGGIGERWGREGEGMESASWRGWIGRGECVQGIESVGMAAG